MPALAMHCTMKGAAQSTYLAHKIDLKWPWWWLLLYIFIPRLVQNGSEHDVCGYVENGVDGNLGLDLYYKYSSFYPIDIHHCLRNCTVFRCMCQMKDDLALNKYNSERT